MEQIVNPQPIAILMATYNGEAFLQEQLDSLHAQTEQGFTIYVHDDGSKDRTPEILQQDATRHTNLKILAYPSTGGAKNNFLSLLDRIDSAYYMFCDQDDVWLDHKIATSFARLKQLEASKQSKPALVYSDLRVVDRQLNMLHESFWQHSGIHPACIRNFDELAAGFLATGCAMMFNRAARDATLLHDATAATMHDAWVTACTMKHSGRVEAISEPLVLYRQHEANTLGAQDVAANTWARKLLQLKRLYRKNQVQYRMFQSLGYGSVLKYIVNKVKFNIRIQQEHGRS